MKNIIIGLTTSLIFAISSNAQTMKDYLVNSQESISKTSPDGLYSEFVSKIVLPKGIIAIASENFTLYTCNDKNFQMIEIPVVSTANNLNLMFVIIDVQSKASRIIFKNHQKEHYEFFDSNLDILYSYDFTDNSIKFADEINARETCYQSCRRKAYKIIEGEFISDFACSFNPCGTAIALYCGIKCL